ncbi:MAG: FAD-dependent oxidoreductase [Peptococcaceae bacterium]|nr:FAD-dependent oxidoreductase [Peptococcaceae bacterium]
MQIFNKIFEPISIKNLTLPNRLVVSAMRTNMVNDKGVIDERYIYYHEEKARGGWGLVITENCLINPESGVSKCLPGLYNDEQVDALKNLTDRVHKAGGHIAAQIYHAGRAGNVEITADKQLVAPSPIRDFTKKDIPRALTIQEIHELTEQFAQAALRAKKAGFDAVEIHGASGYLLSQFTSPYSNKRTDKYGGSTENRTRFSIEVVKRVRELVGEDYPIFYRLTTNEYLDGGLGIEEAKVVAKLLEQAGVDVMHCTQGVFVTNEYTTPPYAVTKGSLISNSAAIKSILNIPVIGVGGHVNTPTMAETILLSNQADMVTMARASLADPFLPVKAKNGDIEDILQCIGCVQGCLGPRKNGIRCLVNPLTGREKEFPKIPARQPKKILVVGGGISGCEFAIMAARQGHRVSLIEKQDHLGGQWCAACMPYGKADFANLINWQRHEMDKYQVEIKLNTELRKDILSKELPDVLAIAIGSIPSVPPIDGLQDCGLLAQDVLLGKCDTGDCVVVIGGGLVGAETAEFLALQGKRVSIVEMLSDIASEAMKNPRKLLLKNLENHHVSTYTDSKVVKVSPTQVDIINQAGNLQEIVCDTVVVATGSRPAEIDGGMINEYSGKVLYVGDACKVGNGLLNLQDALEKAYSL